jgi:Zn-finger nucleic acid-binding protein
MGCPICHTALEFVEPRQAGVAHCPGCGRAWWVERYASTHGEGRARHEVPELHDHPPAR